LAGCGVARSAEIDNTAGNPLGAMQWQGLREEFMGQDPVAFVDAVSITGSARPLPRAR
jgi:sulfur-oxidizing protein SoxY